MQPDDRLRPNMYAYAVLTLEIWHKLFLRDQLYTRQEVSTADLFEIPSSAVAV